MRSEDDGWTWKFAPRAAERFEGLDTHVQGHIVSKLDKVVTFKRRDPGKTLEGLTGGPFEKLRIGQYQLSRPRHRCKYLSCLSTNDESTSESNRP